MSLAATMVFEVRNGGSDTQCSGGFNSVLGGTDYTLQNAAQATGFVTVAGTTCTANSGITFTSAMVGNTITDGTSIREITAFTSSSIVTLDSTTAWSLTTVYIGGGLASPGMAGFYATVASNQIAIKYNASPYSITTASTNVTNGCMSLNANCVVFGYNTTRTPYNTDALQPTLQFSGAVSSGTMIASGANLPIISNLILDGNSQTSSTGSTSGGLTLGCTFKGFTTSCTGTGGVYFNCLFTNNSAASGTCRSNSWNCVATANSTDGFTGNQNLNSISYANTGSACGFTTAFIGCTNCVAYGNGGGRIQDYYKRDVCKLRI